MTESAPAKIGIVTVSDRASRGEYEDRGGPAVHEFLSNVLTSPWEALARIITDEQPLSSRRLWSCVTSPGVAW